MTSTVQLVFRGEVLAGFQVEDVRRDMGRLLRADEAQLRSLFSGRRAVLKRGLAAQEAARYVGRLAAIGAQVHVELESAAAAAASPAAPATRAAGPAPAVPPPARAAQAAAPNPGPTARPAPAPGPTTPTPPAGQTAHAAQTAQASPVAPGAPAPAASGPDSVVSDWPTITLPPEDEPPPPPPPPRPGARPGAQSAAQGPVPALVPGAALAAPQGPSPGASRDLALVAAALPATGEGREVVCPKCGERQTMRVLCRGCATNLEMAFALRQEEEAQRRAERQAALDARLGRRSRAETVVDEGERSAWPLGFGFSGRVGRLAGATANLWLIAAMLLLTAGFLGRPSLPRVVLLGLGALAVFFFSMRLTVLRCHDCGRHGWWALFVLVPYAGSVASLLFSLLPGDRGDNEYGPPPPRARWAWFFVALVVLALAGALTVRAALQFVERQAAAEQEENGEELIDLGGSGHVGGGSAASGPQDAWRDYSQAPGHKAFAASSNLNYAWVGNALSPDDAARRALAQCETRRPPYTPGCRLVNVNGQPVRN